MKHFSRTLTTLIAGPPAISQTELAAKTKIVQSKICRLLQDVIACDRSTLDRIIKAFPNRDDKLSLVNAYLNDVASPEALALLRHGKDPAAALQISGLTKAGHNALVAIAKSSHVQHLDRLLQNLAQAFGVDQ